MKNILVLCTGNICRSPTAHFLLQKELGEDYVVKSAGVAALVDHPADAMSIAIAKNNGLDISSHRAMQINVDLLRWADLILVMEMGHVEYLHEHYPWLKGKVFRYGDPSQVDIPDPYRRPESAFIMAWKFIEKFTSHWVDFIKNSKK
ncbi:MAG: low molecular weight phosphotyrosine protein phosphatase [Fibrobacter sp.]|jgi:protein-tyrosine phosphatase|nr:low molecular weight phosphotyrosine protein phosphatase [Fibrobacter sp.]